MNFHCNFYVRPQKGAKKFRTVVHFQGWRTVAPPDGYFLRYIALMKLINLFWKYIALIKLINERIYIIPLQRALYCQPLGHHLDTLASLSFFLFHLLHFSLRFFYFFCLLHSLFFLLLFRFFFF